MTSPRLFALVLALPVAAAFAGAAEVRRAAELRAALATSEPEAIKALAIDLISRNEQDTASLDVVADRIAAGRDTQEAELSDALAWLCRVIANARASRYKQVLDKVSDTAGTVRLRHYAAVVSVGLPDTGVPQYAPPPPPSAPPPPQSPPPAPPKEEAKPSAPALPPAKEEAKPLPAPPPKVQAQPIPPPPPKVEAKPIPPPKPEDKAPTPLAIPVPAPAVSPPAAPLPAAPPPPTTAAPAPARVAAVAGGSYRLRAGAQLRTRPLSSGLTLDANPGAIRLVDSSRNAEGTWWFAKGERASGWVRESDLASP